MPQRKIRTFAWVGSASIGIASLVIPQVVGCHERVETTYGITGDCPDDGEGCTPTSVTTGAGGAPSGTGTVGGGSSPRSCEDDHNPCTECGEHTNFKHERLAVGKICDHTKGKICNGEGACVDCLDDGVECEEGDCPRCIDAECNIDMDVCLGGLCVDGRCKECEVCRPWNPGVKSCETVSINTEVALCEGTMACDGRGECRRKNGEECDANLKCISNNCKARSSTGPKRCLGNENETCDGDEDCDTIYACVGPDGRKTCQR